MGQLSAESHCAGSVSVVRMYELQEWCIPNALTLLPQRKTRKPALLKAMPPHSNIM